MLRFLNFRWFLILLVLGVVQTSYTLNLISFTIETDKIMQPNTFDFTYAEIERLKLKMQLYEVEAILGRGTRIAESIDKTSYFWQMYREQRLICYFNQNGELIGFQQQRIN